MPSGRLLFLLLLGGTPSLMAPWWPVGPWLTVAFDLLLLTLAALDLRRIPPASALDIARQVPPGGRVGEPLEIRLVLSAPQALFVRIVESPDPRLGEGAVALGGWVRPGRPLALSYRLTPRARGRLPFGPAWFRIRSPLGLGWRDGPRTLPGDARIFPAGPASTVTALPPALIRGRQGLHLSRRPGVGGEFLALREQAPGEGGTRVDWKATARRGVPVVRQFAEERALSVVLILDASRSMGQQIEGATRLDHSIVAAMALAQEAQRLGDRVGMLAITAEGDRFLPPRSGGRALPALRRLTLELQPAPGDLDLGRALGRLEGHPLQGSLLVLFTEVPGAEGADGLLPRLALARRRHQILIGTVRERALEALAEAPITTGDGLLRRGAALTLLEERLGALRALRTRGVAVVDAPPGGFMTALEGQYRRMRGGR